MPNKSGAAPKAAPNQIPPIVGANVGVTATPPRLAGGWQPRRVGTIIIYPMQRTAALSY